VILQRFYDDKLAQVSYLIGCQATGEAIVVDPNRDIAQYLAAARQQALRIVAVTETHIHADFVSGLRELAAQPGVQAHLSGAGGADWQYDFAAGIGARLLQDGSSITVGHVRLDAVHTPGHTPEHLAFLVTDDAGADAPMGMLTGDFVFVGDVGRPDLLERAAGVSGASDAAARLLFRSLQRFKELPDYLQIWPGHGAGSACGKGLGTMPQSTVGYERRFNWALAITDEDQFVATALAGLPQPPRYFGTMKRVNRDGPRLLGGFATPPRLDDDRLADVVQGGRLLDLRPTATFAEQPLVGAVNIPLNRSFATWAGSLVPYDGDIHLVVAPERLAEAVRDLALVGLDRVAGWFRPGAVELWAIGRPARPIEQLEPAELARRREQAEVAVLDVRTDAEWQAGHLAGAQHIPLAELSGRLDEIPSGVPVVVHCQGGSRSSIAASLLRGHGVEEVANLAGGYGAWRREGLPVEADEPATGG
jgi:hydroxyacylglutathione hydrolase